MDHLILRIVLRVLYNPGILLALVGLANLCRWRNEQTVDQLLWFVTATCWCCVRLGWLS
jgi:hypothetical protein